MPYFFGHSISISKANGGIEFERSRQAYHAKPSTFNMNDHILAVEIPWDCVSTNPARVDPLTTCPPALQENGHVSEAPPRD